MLSFQNLHAVRVSKCWSLKNLFPPSIARNLLQLEELDLSNCGVREIVAEEGGETSATGFIFPRFTSLKLWELPKLRSLYPGIHTSERPMLMKFTAYHCNHLKIFTSENGQPDIGAQESLFLVEKVIPKGHGNDIAGPVSRRSVSQTKILLSFHLACFKDFTI